MAVCDRLRALSYVAVAALGLTSAVAAPAVQAAATESKKAGRGWGGSSAEAAKNRGSGLRGFGDGGTIGSTDHRDLQQTACYTCAGNNPCPDRQSGDGFYFEHCNKDRYIQCSESAEQCFDMNCPPGMQWYQMVTTCCMQNDLDCQGQPVMTTTSTTMMTTTTTTTSPAEEETTSTPTTSTTITTKSMVEEETTSTPASSSTTTTTSPDEEETTSIPATSTTTSLDEEETASAPKSTTTTTTTSRDEEETTGTPAISTTATTTSPDEEETTSTLATSSCNGTGETCGTKPCYDHEHDIWPPEPTSLSWCNSNNECESCCCGRYAGKYQVCTTSINPGQGLENVCLDDY